MKKRSFAESGFERRGKLTKRERFLAEMDMAVPWARLIALIEPVHPKLGPCGGRMPFPATTMLRIHFMQLWFNLSDPGMEDALHDIPVMRAFAGLDAGDDALYQGVDKREENRDTKLTWHVAMKAGKRQALRDTPWGRLLDKAEQAKASLRAKVEHPFRIVKRHFGYAKTRYRGLAKNTARLVTLFALANLYQVRHRMAIAAEVRP